MSTHEADAFIALKRVSDMPPQRPNIIPSLLILLWFTLVARPAESLLDRSFITGAGANNVVEQVLEQPDGKILICGLFDHYNGELIPHLLRLNPDGTIDRTFNARPNNFVRHMSLQPDGKIIVGGHFNFVGDKWGNLIARLNADGSPDYSFQIGAGLYESLGTAINGDKSAFVMWTEMLDDGKILALGNFKYFNGELSPAIVRLNPDGSRDTNFNVGSGFDSWARVAKILPDGQMLIGGWFNSYNGRWFNRLVKLNADGSADTSLNAFYGDKTAVYSIVLDGEKIITAGHSLNEQGLFHREIVRLNSDGTVDENWPGRTNEKTECILKQEDGKLILGGYFTMVNNVEARGLARLHGDGTLDSTFKVSCSDFVWTVAQARDQQILISGNFTSIDGTPVGRVARLNLPERKLPKEPRNPTILSVELINGTVECRVNSEGGFKYALHYKTDVESADWVGLDPVEGTGETITLIDANPQETRFYRIEVR